MTNYARNINDVAVDVTTIDPTTIYYPTVAAEFIVVPADVQDGWLYDGSTWSAPVIVIPEPIIEPTRISLEDIRKNLTFSEKTKWDNNSTPEIVTAKIEFAQPLLVEDATEILNFLVESDSISQVSVDKILNKQYWRKKVQGCRPFH